MNIAAAESMTPRKLISMPVMKPARRPTFRIRSAAGTVPQAPQPPQNGGPLTPQNARIVQRALEKSNVRAVIEMTRMIEVTRTYTQVSNLMQQHGDLRRTAVERLAEVPA